ncbi:hypothetical protein HDU86_001246 [Geranomyces michiganensis]|nr:hypothetical protein HDU86_001246 [Geranomyces michiganensis]
MTSHFDNFKWAPEQPPLDWHEATSAIRAQKWEIFSREKQDELLVEIFGYVSEKNPETGKKHAVLPKDPSTLRDKVLRTNCYPYYFRPPGEITHAVLWSRAPMTDDEIESVLKEKLPGCEWIFWVNPPGRKTIPDIEHCHVLSRKRKDI